MNTKSLLSTKSLIILPSSRFQRTEYPFIKGSWERFLIGLASLLLLTTVSAQQLDTETGLIIADGYELVKSECTACHSAQNIIRQSGTRLTWLGLIRWMQDTQGLWAFEPNTEEQILNYLETNYGPKEVSYRRAPIPAFLMPPNPYRTLATLKFVGLQQAYKPGDTLNVELVIEEFPHYSQGRFDLWAAIHLPNRPNSEFFFMTGTASKPLFNSLEPQTFQTSLETVNSTYSILKDYTVPSSIEAGEYTFYALLVEKGTNPLTETDITRSNLAIQTTTVRGF